MNKRALTRLSQVEQFLRDLFQRVDLIVDLVQQPRAMLGKPLVTFERVGEQPQRCDRRAQLV